MSFWTPERVIELRFHFEAGLTGSQIQREMGAATRNVIIGKLTRLGLKREVRPRPPKPPPRTRKAPLQFGRLKPMPASLPPIPAPAPALGRPGPIWNPCSIIEVGDTRCRWPCACDVGSPGFHFCGAQPVEGLPYCAPHCRVAYRRPGEREEAA